MESLEKRTSRIIGQMKGIEKMVQSERDCVDILQQIAAVKKAIDGLTKEIVMLYFNNKVPPERVKEIEQMIERVISI